MPLLAHERENEDSIGEKMRTALEDSIFWPMKQDGRYTCKSGYRFLMEEEENVLQEEPPDADNSFWNHIWALDVPNKVKNLIWRACRNSLPRKENLVRRTIISEATCDRCAACPENPIHALWLYSGLDTVWKPEEEWECRRQKEFRDFKSLTAWILLNDNKPGLR